MSDASGTAYAVTMASPPEHDTTGLPPHTPGAGLERLRKLWGPERVPAEFPAEVEARTDEILAEVARRYAVRRHAA